MRIVADKDVCVGAGMCALTAHDLFEQSEEDGTVVLVVERPADDRLHLVRRVVDSCPSGAITLADD
ncbi:ferredoxin [Nonomuraea terrae]|uniref:Ferredoxin n=1 Tax=Nonomuraea terrae TaxID=2530383 RepID=A0A4R4ZCZ5_9ACTN|nr:ferredoxin [Nonomuraea terrae]TDD54202.1 ferredoxin [Nonomuraea terrae]